jgi:AraC-like DNA-binding protein
MQPLKMKMQLRNGQPVREEPSMRIALRPQPVMALSIEEVFLRRILAIVEENIANTSFGVELLSEEAAMSPAQLYRKMTALTAYSPNEFIRHMRLTRAADLLRQRAGNVADIAYQTGFGSLSYFSKCFKQKFGMVPSEYTKIHIAYNQSGFAG